LRSPARKSTTAALTNVGLPHGTARQGTPLDFAAAGAELTSLSAARAALTPDGTTTNNYGTLTLTGTDPALDVFAVSSAQRAGANSLNVSAPAGASVLVNVSGTSGQMQYCGMTVSGTDRQHVVFNFAAATSLTLTGISVEGSVLAPGAEVAFNNGNLNGTLVARSLTGSGEFHNVSSQFQIAVTRPAVGQLSGTLFIDANKDGLRQLGESGHGGRA
jgi:choice-of-anchor A domain-containing protein